LGEPPGQRRRGAQGQPCRLRRDGARHVHARLWSLTDGDGGDDLVGERVDRHDGIPHPYRDATLAKIWRRACQEAGVPCVSPYAASKHTIYSELARAGWDLLALQRMGRHRDPKTTLGYIEEFGPSRGETQRAREELEERQRREDRVVPFRRER
jgi:integrase